MDAKKNGNKLTMLTAYDYSTAQMFDRCGIDGLLVGDSLGMVFLGYKDTVRVTMEDMLHHTKAVAAGARETLLVADMPFMSYQTSVYDAVKNAGRLIQEGGAEAVKLEGGSRSEQQAKAIVNAQIPVMGHLGLTPQSVHAFGGYKVQGKNAPHAKMLIDDARCLEQAGVFAIVLECIPKELAALITEAVSVPTIGIGAGVGCDGQILVYQDIFSMYSDYKPKFIKNYGNVGEIMTNGVKQYMEEVKSGAFPDDAHSFSMETAELEKV